MWILPLVGFVGVIFFFCFLVLAIGSWPPIPPRITCVSRQLTVRKTPSLGPVLSVRNNRRAHRPIQKDPHAPHLHHHPGATSPLHRRPLSLQTHPPLDRQPCGIHAEHAPFPHCEAQRPILHTLHRFAVPPSPLFMFRIACQNDLHANI
jgi:hypothetical protein